MAATSQRLTTTEYAMLGLLASGESSGYDLARAADRSIRYMWAPSRSQIYKALPRLVALGLATRREVEQRGRPDKAVYRITRAGRTTLRAWLNDDTEASQAGGTVFLLKLFLAGAAPPDAALRQLEAYQNRLERRLAAFEEMEREPADSQTVYDRIALAHGLAQARATLGWVENVRPQLEREARRRRRSGTRG
ncbi:MAG TPA: PadR family transcriptional regulator [Gaiella sp.]|jgi:DNA-binding PadR family transcriptional regulator|nr:PadR family transcriptional regulator [Gaiella sp.]